MNSKVYKYIQSKWKLDFIERGSLKLRTLAYYRKGEDSRGDEKEGTKIWELSNHKEEVIIPEKTIQEIMDGNVRIRGGDIVARPGGEIKMQTALPNPLVFCTSSVLDDSLFKRWKCDSYFSIIDPKGFSNCLLNEINKRLTIVASCYDFIKYVDDKNYRIIGAIEKENISIYFESQNTVINLSMLKRYFGNYYIKEKCYSDEKEFRFIYLPYQIIDDKYSLDIECSELLHFVKVM